jgi:hypothetical protein
MCECGKQSARSNVTLKVKRYWLALFLPLLGCGHSSIGQIAAVTAIAATEAVVNAAMNEGYSSTAPDPDPSTSGVIVCGYQDCALGYVCENGECVSPPDPNMSCTPVPDAGSMLIVACEGGTQ